MTIVHNVLFKLKDPARVGETAKVLRSMEGKIAELKQIEVGVDQLDTPRSYHIALVTQFETWADFDVYREHPEHKPVLAHMAEVVEHAAVVDYEI